MYDESKDAYDANMGGHANHDRHSGGWV